MKAKPAKSLKKISAMKSGKGSATKTFHAGAFGSARKKVFGLSKKEDGGKC